VDLLVDLDAAWLAEGHRSRADRAWVTVSFGVFVEAYPHAGRLTAWRATARTVAAVVIALAIANVVE